MSRRRLVVLAGVVLGALMLAGAFTGALYYRRWEHESGPGNPDFTTSNRLLAALKARPLSADEVAELARVARGGWWGPNRTLALSVLSAAAERSPEHRPAVRESLSAALNDPDESVRQAAAQMLAKLPAD